MNPPHPNPLLILLVAAAGAAFGAGVALAETPEVEPNDTLASSNVASCNVTICGAISVSGDNDYFCFVLDRTANLHLYTTISGSDSYIHLYDAQGVQVEADDDSGDGLASHIGRSAQPPGTYYVRVRGFSSSSIFNYNLFIDCVYDHRVEVEPNDDLSSATRLDCEDRGVSGVIASANELDYFWFPINAESTVSFFGLPIPDDRALTISVHDASGTQIASNSVLGANLAARITTSLAEGLYYLRVTNNVASTGYDIDFNVVTRRCTEVTSIAPTVGSSLGGEPAYVLGLRFPAAGQISVLFGGTGATVVAATSDRVDVITPPGTASVDVTVTTPAGSFTLPSAYTYVPPEIAARFGNVNLGAGDREDVLFVNGSAGDPMTREVIIPVRTLIRGVVIAPSSRAQAGFAIYGWPGHPDASTLTIQPRGIGWMVLPTPINSGASPQPVAIFNNLDPRAGIANMPSSPAPSTLFTVPQGVRRPALATLQGFIQDNGSAIPERASITNAVLLRIQ
jgi:hypothetical protein